MKGRRIVLVACAVLVGQELIFPLLFVGQHVNWLRLGLTVLLVVPLGLGHTWARLLMLVLLSASLLFGVALFLLGGNPTLTRTAMAILVLLPNAAVLGALSLSQSVRAFFLVRRIADDLRGAA